MLVFTYGTLRHGESNARLLAQADYCACFVSPPGYQLFDTGAFPAAVARGDMPIVGEIYRIGPSTLAALDTLEDYPSLYTRQLIDTPVGAAWIYLWAGDVDARWPVIADGDWCRHRRRRPSQSLGDSS